MHPFAPLPIDVFKEQIEREISRNPVTILTAETGAGKSTRVPYWLFARGKRVHVTQPRRIAARSLSHYLASVSSTTWGKEIGYQTGFESRKSAATSLLYLTDGVQMVQEIQGNRNYDVLVLDEIHEWNLNQEVLVGLVRENLEKGYYRRAGKRVVVMSATMKAKQLSAFLLQAPVICVPGRGYPVTLHHHSPLFLLPDAAALVEEGRNLLVFQPGKQEIDEFIRNLRELLPADQRKAVILPLHSELPIREQTKVFDHFPHPKVVVATDIAQTSLTIDDIDAVVDAGFKKEVRVVSGIEGLYPTDISSSECTQRAGRSGRVKNGVYILCAEKGIDDRLEYPEPEIRRLNLETVVLRMFTWGLSPLTFTFFHKPKKNLILKAVETLQIFGALTGDHKVTADGRRMAGLPVSIRSSRMLLEAEKGGPKTVDKALKLIAILECRGIVSKEFAGERFCTDALKSDLLNQLELWESARRNSPFISRKKLAMAQEIYIEIKKRIRAPETHGHLSEGEKRALYRALLSSFVDRVYFRNESGYFREGEERQLDRTSMLLEAKPPMVVGLPFDLLINREDPKTGAREELAFPLITFASELSFSQLEELKPYSYRKEREIGVDKGRISITEKIFFGGNLIQTVERAPDWKNRPERSAVVSRGLQWVEQNLQQLPLCGEMEKNRAWVEEVRPLLPHPSPPFADCFRKFLFRQLQKNLNTQDIAYFIHTDPRFSRIGLSDLLPAPLIQKLKQMRWPSGLNHGGTVLPVVYIERKPYIEIRFDPFKKFSREDAILPTGEPAGIILDDQRCESWQEAVARYNARLKREIFDQKWKGDKKPARWNDLLDVPFPLAFIGGRGKEEACFEFFSAPLVEEREVYLIHFFSLPEARDYCDSLGGRWEALKKEFKKSTLENAFREMGWKVRG
jgi:hypothetical protein